MIECKAKQLAYITQVTEYHTLTSTSQLLLLECYKVHNKITKDGTMAHKYKQAKECRFGLGCIRGTQPVSHICLIHKTLDE